MQESLEVFSLWHVVKIISYEQDRKENKQTKKNPGIHL